MLKKSGKLNQSQRFKQFHFLDCGLLESVPHNCTHGLGLWNCGEIKFQMLN